MRKALLFLAGLTLGGSMTLRGLPAQEKPKESQPPAKEAQAAAEEFKIPPEDVKRANPVKPTPDGLAQAKKLFGYHCEMCHNADGSGKGELAVTMKLTLQDWRDPASLKNMTDGELFYIISHGKGKMVGEGDRQKPEMMWNLVHLVRSFAKKEPDRAPKRETPKP
jgi:mono/diheme cytochrome c family protein